MDMNGFIEGECGGANPLLQLKSHFASNSTQSLNNNEILNIPQHIELDEEFLFQPLTSLDNRVLLDTAPTTFSMDSLLNEMKQIDNHQQSMPLVPVVVEDSHPASAFLADEWLNEVEEVVPHGTQSTPRPVHDWSTHFLAEGHLHSSLNGFERFPPTWQDFHSTGLEQKDDNWMDGFLMAGNQDFTVDPESDHIFEAAEAPSVAEQKEVPINDEDAIRSFWETAQEEWSSIEDSLWHQQHLNFNDYTLNEYQFEQDNPVKDHPGALEEGIRRLQEGDVPNAVLFLEAAVQNELENPKAWLYLGKSRADNEQELAAIAAFEKCLELDANNMEALMSLAVSYTNEGHTYKAIESLFKWIKQNPKYSEIASDKVLEDYKVSRNAVSSKEELVDLFLKAARMSGDIDPNLQDGLGVLFNIMGDYNKAADCFRTALHVLPESSTLWNKLGATLANGRRSGEALEAYHRALNQRPGYVRTRFNLGVACYNLKAYRESIEHYLSALNLQKNSNGPAEGTNLAIPKTSGSIWPSLRLSMSLLGMTDLLPACDSRQLDVLNREFGVV